MTTALLIGIYAAGVLQAQAPTAPQRPTAAQPVPPTTTPQSYSADLVQRGRPLFAAHCGFCHGRDAEGGGESGTDLTRSMLVAEDVRGDKIGPVVRSGRVDNGMPAFDLAADEVAAIVAFIHDQKNKASSSVGNRRTVEVADLQTGDAGAGKRYFDGAGGCARCHSPSADLAGIAKRLQGLTLLQRMLYPAGRGVGSEGRSATVTVTLPSGQTVAGKLAYRDEFTIAVTGADGWYRSWPASQVRFTVDNPLDAHVELLAKYTDEDMHNVLAYLHTLTEGAPKSAASLAPRAEGERRTASDSERRTASDSERRTASEASPAPRAEGEPRTASEGERRTASEASPAPRAEGEPRTASDSEPRTASAASPPTDSWPTYHGDYSGQRHSRLTQITPANVHQLALAWTFQTGQAAQIKAVPILVNGILYVSTPDNVWALDARSARQIWHYSYPANQGFHIGHRGVAVHKDSVYLTTPDAHLVALDARNGKVRWNVVIADSKRGYWSTNAPLVIRDHVIVGVAGDFDNLPGLLKSFDPETGKTQWTFYSTPPPGTPGNPSGGATGGQMWMTGTYDPQLNLMYVGTGNPTPVLNGPARPGDNPWTCSIVALDPDTGKLAWGFQASPHDTHDWDAAEVPVLIDGNFDGTPRKMLLQASRNGYFFVLDRTNGKSLLTSTFATVNWTTGVDKDGRPIPDPAKEPARDGRLVAPDEGGATNYRSPSFDPKTGLLIVSARDAYAIYFFKPEHGEYGWAGADYGVWSRGALRAIDYQTGKVRWSHDIGEGGSGAGVLTTESGLTFSGDSNTNVLALRTSDGATLWHSSIGRVGNSPVTYELDGRQYLLVAGGSALYAFALPEKLVVSDGSR